MKKTKNENDDDQININSGENRAVRLIKELKACQLELKSLKNIYREKLHLGILEAQENERHQVSRALHNSVCQILYGIKLHLQSISELKYPGVDWQKLKKLIDQAIEETRGISHSLTPFFLDRFGFADGIKEMTRSLSSASFKITCDITGSVDKYPPAFQNHIFHIIQELVNNSIKHASASKVFISVMEDRNKIKIVVKDDGRGFKNSSTGTPKQGIGLKSIENQAHLLNGELSYKTTKNGTTVCLICKTI